MPTTTNLGIPYPNSSSYVTNGATDMGGIATGIDDFFGAMTTYTPTFTNCSSPVVDARYRKIGKMLHVMIDGTSGTVTAAGTITISLPAGNTAISVRTPVSAEFAGTGVIHAYITSSGTAITVTGTAAGGNFSAGAGLGNLALNVLLSVQ